MRNEKSFASEFSEFFLQNFNHFFIIRKLLCGLNNFIRDSGVFTLGQDYHLWKFARSSQELIIIELCRIDLLFH